MTDLLCEGSYSDMAWGLEEGTVECPECGETLFPEGDRPVVPAHPIRTNYQETPQMPENETPRPDTPPPGGGAQRATEWPLRGRDDWLAEELLAELQSRSGAGGIQGLSIGWAYDTIRELVGIIRGFEAATAILNGMPDRTLDLNHWRAVRGFTDADAPPSITAEGLRDLRAEILADADEAAAVWRTGRSVEPRVTLYKHNRIVGLLLTAEMAAEVVARCNATVTGESSFTISEVNTTERTFTAGDVEVSEASVVALLGLASTAVQDANPFGLGVETVDKLRVAVREISALLDVIDPA